jgi:hypothetical protein
MAGVNPMLAETDLGGHLLRMDFNAWCVLEGMMGKKVPEILNMMDAGLGFGDIRSCIRAFHVEPITETEAGNLIGSVGFEAATVALSKLCDGFFGDPGEEPEADPPKAG